ncbi:MAG: hypothetical protein ACRC33_03575 [Gemmataceae bacterium]
MPDGRRWKALWTSLGGLAALAAAIWAFTALGPLDPWGDAVTVGAMTVHYPHDVPTEAAEKLARFLHGKGIGRDERAEARLRRAGGGWAVDLFVPRTAETDTDAFAALLARMHADIGRDVTGGGPLVVRACHPEVATDRTDRRAEPEAWREFGP